MLIVYTDEDGGTTEIELFLSCSTLFCFLWFQIVCKAFVMLSWCYEEEKIHVFKELDSPALSLLFSLQSFREAEQRRLYNILSWSVILFPLALLVIYLYWFTWYMKPSSERFSEPLLIGRTERRLLSIWKRLTFFHFLSQLLERFFYSDCFQSLYSSEYSTIEKFLRYPFTGSQITRL